MLKQRGYNFFGNLAVVNFPRGTSKSEKQKFALNLIKKNKSVKTVLEKSEQFKGRLRKMKTAWLAGEKTKEVLYKENNCTFRFNIDETYFSPRLSNERKEIASYIKKGQEVLVMFAGVAPFPIVIAKNSQAKIIYSNELNKTANKYAELNIKLNHVEKKVVLIPGDIKKVAEKIKKGWKINPTFLPLFSNSRSSLDFPRVNSRHPFKNIVPKTFDIIIMPRPQLKDSFLDSAFKLSKKGTEIYYYDFCSEGNKKSHQTTPDHPPQNYANFSSARKNKINDINSVIEKVKLEAKKYKKKIKILRCKHAGEIAPYKIRVRIDFKVLS